MTTLNRIRLQGAHKRLRKYRYLYYELHQSPVSDYEYDMLERKYIGLCDKLNIPEEIRVTNFVGFSINIPMNIHNALKLYATK